MSNKEELKQGLSVLADAIREKSPGGGPRS